MSVLEVEQMKDLIVLCGTSHSGKSDYARQYEVTHTIISSDEIRAELKRKLLQVVESEPEG